MSSRDDDTPRLDIPRDTADSPSIHSVRRARHGDREHWLALRVALFPDVDPDRHEHFVRRSLIDPGRHPTLVVESDGAVVVGLMECHRPPGDPSVAHVAALFVAPPHRGKGMGSALLARMEHELALAGVTDMLLDVDHTAEEFIAAVEGIAFGDARRMVRFQRSTTGVAQLARGSVQGDAPAAAVGVGAGVPIVVTDGDHAEPVRSYRRSVINIVLAIIAIVCALNTNIFSSELVPGMLMPLLDVVFVIYFIGAFLAWRYGRRADSSQRMGELYGGEKDRP